ncbi:MAG TPA: MFS transporter [Anaerolineales bacterium]|nr:MFS transporter [Anaerolineales bacterium]
MQNTQSTNRPTGMVGFTLVWLGQIVSVLATNMSLFALTIWVFEETGSATALGLMQVFFIAPLLIVTPFAGVLVDRHNRKMMMMVSDLTAGVATVSILILQALGILEVWHLYAAAVLQGLGNAFQWPAYSAAISTMIPKEKYGRANGMMSLIDMGPGVLAPMLAGALLPVIGLTGILSLDVVTFLLAIGVLLFVHIPQPPRTSEGAQAQGHILKEALFGFRYIFARPSLLGLQLVFFFGNLCSGIALTVLAPMILLRTGNDSVSLGFVLSAGAIGGVVGGIAMSAWGGFKRRVHGVLGGWIVCSFFFAMMGLGTWVPFWVVMNAFAALFIPLINGSNQAIWQTKVAPDVQGRVFSARTLIAWLTNPISPLIAGTLADYVLEPAMSVPGGLSALFGGLVPPGPGAGMGLLIFLSSLGGMLAGLIGYFVHPIRHAEDILPDHDLKATAETA